MCCSEIEVVKDASGQVTDSFCIEKPWESTKVVEGVENKEAFSYSRF
jgi:hypothetical protein